MDGRRCGRGLDGTSESLLTEPPDASSEASYGQTRGAALAKLAHLEERIAELVPEVERLRKARNLFL